MTRYVSMPTLLAIHIYAGIIGPILVILHTGHKFTSGLGISLTGMTITIVISGFVGRYLLSYVGREIEEKHTELDQLNKAYEQATQEMQTQPELAGSARFLRPLATQRRVTARR